MLIIEIVYLVKENQKSVKIFKHKFVKKMQKKCKIRYKNKIYPLQGEFKIENESLNKLKISLICYDHYDLDMNDLMKACGDFYELYPSSKYKNNIAIFLGIKDRQFYNWSLNKYKKESDNGKIRIFGEKFVDKYKNDCVLVFKGRYFWLKEFFFKDEIGENDAFLELLLIECVYITDRSYMFYLCDSLIGFVTYEDIKHYIEDTEITKENTSLYPINEIKDKKEITNFYNSYHLSSSFAPDKSKLNTCFNPYMNSIFKENETIMNMSFGERMNWLSAIIPYEQLSKWNVSYVVDMSYMFYNCTSLVDLPDISEWNLNRVTNISYMFAGCSALTSLNCIIKWDTKNIINMRGLFYDCNLELLPDISNWNTHNVIDMSHMFNGCCSLKSLPDISKWNTDNVFDMSCMFNGCKELKALPDISKFNIHNVNELYGIFKECSSLQTLPDLSKWNTENVNNMSCMFKECSSLKYLPDISKWNTISVNDLSDIFNGCSSLKSLPDISKWNTKSLTNMNNLFFKCSSLY